VGLADATAARLRAAGLAARTVTVKVRFADFRTITRSSTLPVPVVTGPALARVALGLLAAVDVSAGVRLLGVSVGHLGIGDGPPPRQLRLDDPVGAGSDPDTPWVDASRAVDEVRRRFGADAIGPAVLARSGRLRVTRRGRGPWGPDRPAGAHEPGADGR
jgi:DNA polymerase-4